MNMFARFDENPAMTLQVIKKKPKKRYKRTDTQTHAHTDNVKTVYPPQTKFAGGIIIFSYTLLSGGPECITSYGINYHSDINTQFCMM